jgi:hypothetical protein
MHTKPVASVKTDLNIRSKVVKKQEPVAKKENVLPATRMAQTGTANNKTVVDLPGNVQPHAVRGIVERAAAQAHSGITFNLPGNVSVQVARAYGEAVARLGRRSRSRSPRRARSPDDRSYRSRRDDDDYWRRRDLSPGRDGDRHYHRSEHSRRGSSPRVRPDYYNG